MRVFLYKFGGPYAPFFWLMVFCNFLLPVIILSNRKFKKIPGILVASIGVVVGMWLERLIIIIPTLANPRLPYPTGMYIPSVTEISIFAAGMAAFVLGFMGFSKMFPLISIWETKEGRLHSVHEVSMRLKEYLPGKTEENRVEASVKAEI